MVHKISLMSLYIFTKHQSKQTYSIYRLPKNVWSLVVIQKVLRKPAIKEWIFQNQSSDIDLNVDKQFLPTGKNTLDYLFSIYTKRKVLWRISWRKSPIYFILSPTLYISLCYKVSHFVKIWLKSLVLV